MRMRLVERWLMRTPVRAWLQRHVEAPRLFRGMDLPPGAMCLEIGAGHGLGALLIDARFRPREVVAVDLDPAMMRAASRRLARPPRWAGPTAADRIQLLLANAARLPLADVSFDAAFLFGVLHHIRHWERAVAEVFRVLAPGGVFALEEVLIAGRPGWLDRNWKHVPFGEAGLRAALREAGFEIERFDRLHLGLPFVFARARRPDL